MRHANASPTRANVMAGPPVGNFRAKNITTAAWLAEQSGCTGLCAAEVENETFAREGLPHRCTIYNHRVMKTPIIPVALVFVCLTACNKSDAPAKASSSGSSKPPDVLQLKLQEYAGTSASNCGRLDVHATQVELKTASDCAQLGNQKKQPFFVAYD